MKWILGIFLVFFLIVATNLIDRDSFIRVKNSIVTIYEDRLIAQGLILELSNLIREKELAIAVSDAAFFEQRNKAVNSEIEVLISRFASTRLTDQENNVFNRLQANLKGLNNLENSPGLMQPDNRNNYKVQIGLIVQNLRELSDIQIEEGRHQTMLGKEAVKTVELYTRLEIYLLIFLAVLVQVLIIYTPKQEVFSGKKD